MPDLTKITLPLFYIFFFLNFHLEAQPFHLKGEITGKDTGWVYLYYKDFNLLKVHDSFFLKKGEFEFKGTVKGADYVFLNTNKNYPRSDDTFNGYFFLDTGVCYMTFVYGCIGEARFNNSASNAQYRAFKDTYAQVYKEKKENSFAFDSIRQAMQDGKVASEVSDKMLIDLREKSRSISKTIAAIELAYITQHPDSYISPRLLIPYAQGYIPIDSAEHLYNNFSKSVKESSIGIFFYEIFAGYKERMVSVSPFNKIQLNQSAPSFTIFKNNQQLSPVFFRERLLLLEFWDIDCIPCLESNLFLEDLRKKYGPKGFEIIGIAYTSPNNLKKVLRYIKKGHLSKWIHVSPRKQLEGLNKNIFYGNFDDYENSTIPYTVLINKEGNVIYKTVGYSKKELKNLETMIKKNLRN